jgi:hypothetical protein
MNIKEKKYKNDIGYLTNTIFLIAILISISLFMKFFSLYFDLNFF